MPIPPSAAVRLVLEGHPVAQVIEWTGCSRWHLERAVKGRGLLIDPGTDTAHAVSDSGDESPPAWRVWAKTHGWPGLPDSGPLPKGVLEAYLVAVPHDEEAAAYHQHLLYNRERNAIYRQRVREGRTA